MTIIGIVGHGYVGKAVEIQFADADVHIVDVDTKLTLTELVTKKKVEYIFVCLPTPTSNGKCDCSLIDDALAQLSKLKKCPPVIIKSTVDPGSLNNLASKYSTLDLVHVPEFLTQANYENDAVGMDQLIIGTSNPGIGDEIAELYMRYLPFYCNPEITVVDLGTSALAKYAINCFLATKVTFMNHMYELHQATENCSDAFRALQSVISNDSRIGQSHTTVPGDNDEFGFGGACFPKDTKAFSSYSNSVGHPFDLLDAVIKQNTNFRSKNEP